MHRITNAKTTKHACSDDLWQSSPDLIRNFLQLRPDYEKLCEEVHYILQKKIIGQDIKISSINYRAKSLESFLEKTQRKSYDNPLFEMTDLAGVRIICLYSEDIKLTEKIIENEFCVIEKNDKLSEKNADQFGYNSIHFLVKLGQEIRGARYDELRNLICEIQVRTVLQDAWAIIGHHLVYKNESSIPKFLQRKLNSLAGLFETADDQFERIRYLRNEYIEEMKTSVKSVEVFLENDVNMDSLREYLQWKFPNEPVEYRDGQLSIILEDVPLNSYFTLNDIEKLMNDTASIRAKIVNETEQNILKVNGLIPSSVHLGMAFAVTHQKYFEQTRISQGSRDIIQRIIYNNKENTD